MERLEMHPSAIATAFAEARADLLDAARHLAQEHRSTSTSFLQRRLRIGYPRAARLMVKLEEEGFERESGKRKLEN
jgi:DNA segregation ATPase FtsK/SpoIIIE-like protein